MVDGGRIRIKYLADVSVSFPQLDAKTCIRDMREAERLYAAQGTTLLGVYVVLADCYKMAGRDAEKNGTCEKAKKIVPATAADRLDSSHMKSVCGS